ncbi:hypothetical protein AB0F43_04215 [Kribbella sp. NPDC023972]|uniref:hypothetical protein n=1 Tax=Kribbella sp. NPDC023972 TaxID=3154795 RepID=UPI003405BB68
MMPREKQDAADRLTAEIKRELNDARGWIEAVAVLAQDNRYGSLIADRLQDVRNLRGLVDPVREAERKYASSGNDNERLDAWADVGRTFGAAQATAGALVERIAETEQGIDGLVGLVRRSSKAIEKGIEHLDSLEHLLDRQTPETRRFRLRLDNLKGALATAGDTLGRSMSRQESARYLAKQFETAELDADESWQHSAAVEQTSSTLETDLSVAGEALRGLRGQTDITGPATREAIIETSDLAKAARAGLTPPTGQGPRGKYGMGEQDRRYGTGGPSDTRGFHR